MVKFCTEAESRQLGPVSQNLQSRLLVSSFLQSTKIQRKYFNQQFCNAAKILDSGVGIESRENTVVGGFIGLVVQVQRFLSFLGCSSRPSTKHFFSSPYTISHHLSESPSKLGRQSCRFAFILICVSTREILIMESIKIEKEKEERILRIKKEK